MKYSVCLRLAGDQKSALVRVLACGFVVLNCITLQSHCDATHFVKLYFITPLF